MCFILRLRHVLGLNEALHVQVDPVKMASVEKEAARDGSFRCLGCVQNLLKDGPIYGTIRIKSFKDVVGI